MTDHSTLITYSAYIWLGFAGFAILLEAFAVPGIGFLFAGIGAIITGGLITSGLVLHEDIAMQCISFCAATIGASLILWKPLKRFHQRAQGAGYNNIIGQTATIIESPLSKGKTGKATWSGTIMQARLASDAKHATIPVGNDAVITAIEGNILILS